jgi:hypothetical protein
MMALNVSVVSSIFHFNKHTHAASRGILKFMFRHTDKCAIWEKNLLMVLNFLLIVLDL